MGQSHRSLPLRGTTSLTASRPPSEPLRSGTGSRITRTSFGASIFAIVESATVLRVAPDEVYC